MKNKVFEVGNWVYKTVPSLYRPAYRLYKHWSDRWEFRLLAEHVKPGMLVADVGANIGIYSSQLARLVGPQGHVFSFEPDSRNFQFLAQEVTPYANVTAVNAAVGAANGEITLYLSESLNVDHHTYDDGTGRPSTVVQVISLDQYFDKKPTPDFIKMDIQGYELHALKGFENMMRGENPPKLFFEFWPFGIRQAGNDPLQIFDLLNDCGYQWQPSSESGSSVLKQASNCNDPGIYTNILSFR